MSRQQEKKEQQKVGDGGEEPEEEEDAAAKPVVAENEPPDTEAIIDNGIGTTGHSVEVPTQHLFWGGQKSGGEEASAELEKKRKPAATAPASAAMGACGRAGGRCTGAGASVDARDPLSHGESNVEEEVRRGDKRQDQPRPAHRLDPDGGTESVAPG